MSEQPVDEPTAETSVDIAVDIDRVWAALITDGGLEPWMGDGATIDPRVDGALELPDPVGGRRRRGRVDRVEREQRLDFTWWPESRPIDRSQVSITLTPLETGTRVTVIETVPRSVRRSIATGATRSVDHRPVTSPITASTSLVGAWSWRLAMITLACRAARV